MATFTNQATLTYNGGTVNSNIVTGELVQVLTASKTAAAESYRTGDLVTYVVQLRSTGAAALTGLTVTDTLGTTNYPATGGTVQLTPLTYQAGTLRYFMNGVLQTAPAVTVLANGIRIEGITVPAGGVSTLAYTARVNAFADPSAAGAISNTASVTGGSLTEAVTAVETLPAATEPDLRITKALEPVQVSDSGTLTYTFTIENYGGAAADAAAGITVTDRFDPILRGIAVTYNSDAWLASNYTYDPAQSRFRPPPPFRILRPAHGPLPPALPPCRSPARSDSSQPAADAAGIFLRFPACILQRFMLPCG